MEGLILFLSFLAGFGIFVGAEHLWNGRIRRLSMLIAGLLTLIGILLVFADSSRNSGMTITVMAIPLIYLTFFCVARLIFKRIYNTEPYITSSSSSIGGRPLDFLNTGKTQARKKYGRGRKIMAADFVFTIGHILGTVFTILFLLALFGK